MNQLGECVRKTAGTHVVNRENRVCAAQRPAAVDDLLGSALDLRIAALDRIEIEVLEVGSRIHARGRTAAQTDQHSWAAELNQQGIVRQPLLQRMLGRQVADAAGNHDRLVVAAHRAGHALLEGPEIAG